MARKKRLSVAALLRFQFALLARIPSREVQDPDNDGTNNEDQVE